MDKEDKGQKGQIINAVLKIIWGAIYIGVGHYYLSDCPNGAASYLFYAGIILVALNGVSIFGIFFKKCAESDGKINCIESCGICLVSVTGLVLAIANIVVLIWGSVVVFGAYSEWTYKEEDKLKIQYCAYTPFITAFVLLIIDWVLLPFLCVCASFTAVCGAMQRN